MRRLAVKGLLAAWAIVFALSLLTRFVVEPTGDGFTRGMNRLWIMVGWQVVAMILAVLAFHHSRKFVKGDRLRRLVWGPVILAILFICAMAAPFVLGA
jgi:hypothetical protein